MRTDVLGVGFDDLTLEEAAAAGAALVDAGGFHYAVTPNPEFLLAAKHNPAFRQALLGADLVLADGVGVVYSAKILGRPLKGKVPGIDFAQRLLAWMARHGKRLFLLGAKPGVAELAAANLKDAHPGCVICLVYICYGSIMGPINFDNAKKTREKATRAAKRLYPRRPRPARSARHAIRQT